MEQQQTMRILVVTDHADPSQALLEAITHRAETRDAQFRIVVPNPARAELHLLHPERHDKAHEAEQVLRRAQPLLERAAGGPVIGTVSVRSDPMDAIEETIFSEPIDEIILSVAPHGLSTWLHQDLAHRLHHFGLPVTVVAAGAATR
jgi:nucleotide-binding universal stress UspA family protein